MHHSRSGQEPGGSCCILFVPHFQSGSCLKPQNHSTSHLEIGNRNLQGSAAGLRAIKHYVGLTPPTELISSTFSTQNLPADFRGNCIYVSLQHLNYSAWKSEINPSVQHQKFSFMVVQVTNLYMDEPGWVSRQKQLPLTHTDRFLFQRESGAITSGEVCWLGFSITILVALQIFEEKQSQRAAK